VASAVMAWRGQAAAGRRHRRHVGLCVAFSPATGHRFELASW